VIALPADSRCGTAEFDTTVQQAVASGQQREQRPLDEGAGQLLTGGLRGDVDERATGVGAVGGAFPVEERHQHRALRRPRGQRQLRDPRKVRAKQYGSPVDHSRRVERAHQRR
jgi:hypothetical protein